MIMGISSFALISVFHAVLVDEGNHEKLYVFPQPLPRTLSRQYLLQQSFQTEARDRLAGVVATRQQHAVSRGPIQLT